MLQYLSQGKVLARCLSHRHAYFQDCMYCNVLLWLTALKVMAVFSVVAASLSTFFGMLAMLGRLVSPKHDSSDEPCQDVLSRHVEGESRHYYGDV